MDLDCFLQTHSFCLLKTLTGELEWCGLLWCFYQLLDSHSDGNPFTAFINLYTERASILKCHYIIVTSGAGPRAVERSEDQYKTRKSRPWSSLVLYCRRSSFYPSGAPPWDSRPVSGCRCRSSSLTPPASFRSHGSRPRPTRTIIHRLTALFSDIP